jgi:hypothetical protein
VISLSELGKEQQSARCRLSSSPVLIRVTTPSRERSEESGADRSSDYDNDNDWVRCSTGS